MLDFQKLSVVIITCDKYSDLLPLILRTQKNFDDIGVKCVIFGEYNTYENKNLNYYATGENVFSTKLFCAVEKINTKYVLILLDDYFVFDRHLEYKIQKWINSLEFNYAEALKISKKTNPYVKLASIDKFTKRFKNMAPYYIDFHPTIWKSDTIKNILSANKNLSAWELEPRLSSYFKKNPSVALHSTLLIKYNELVVGGVFFRRPFNKHCKDIYIGNRKKMSLLQTFNYHVNHFFLVMTPKFIKNKLKKFLFKNRKFYSDNY